MVQVHLTKLNSLHPYLQTAYDHSKTRLLNEIHVCSMSNVSRKKVFSTTPVGTSTCAGDLIEKNNGKGRSHTCRAKLNLITYKFHNLI